MTILPQHQSPLIDPTNRKSLLIPVRLSASPPKIRFEGGRYQPLDNESAVAGDNSPSDQISGVNLSRRSPDSFGWIVGNSSAVETSGLRLDSDTVIHGRCDPLGAAEVTLGGLHGNVPEKKLNLFQFAAGGAAEPSATSAEIVRREFANANLGGELLDDVPDELFRHSFAPNLAGAAYTPEETTGLDPSRRRPVIQNLGHPVRNWDSSNVTTLPTEVHNCPMSLSLLKMADSQSCQFMPPKPAGK